MTRILVHGGPPAHTAHRLLAVRLTAPSTAWAPRCRRGAQLVCLPRTRAHARLAVARATLPAWAITPRAKPTLVTAHGADRQPSPARTSANTISPWSLR